MNPEEFPLVISPNLGCPEIVPVGDLKNGMTIPLIVAGQFGEFASPLKDVFDNALFLRPSYDDSGRIPLHVVGEPEEITGWNSLADFQNIRATRELINSELHYNVLGEETRYWKLNVSIKDNFDRLLRKRGELIHPKLFDLILMDKHAQSEKINYHAVQFVEDTNKEFVFIHVTDIHAAKRNDEILDEVLKVKCTRGRNEIISNYLNFNEKFREFIHIANDLAEKGELDFVVIAGDLVDFAFLGWDDETNIAENNWKIFINMITGAANEKERGNPGIKVAVFTSTGNHDWRLHPFDPSTGSCNEKYGLAKEDIRHYPYRCFDSTENSEDENSRLAKELSAKAFERLDLNAFTDKFKMQTAKFVSRKITTVILGIAYALGGTGVIGYTGKAVNAVVIAILGLGLWLVKKFIQKKFRKYIDLIIDNPLHAEAAALHYYLKHVNPYLDYAFRYGDHCFIVMDTGSDVFNGRLLDGKTIDDIGRISIEDNLLGGSPDSRAFDSEQKYYNWSQIVWLEKVLSSVAADDSGKCKKTFMFLHAPPINMKEDENFEWRVLWERTRKDPKWIPKDEYNLTYCSINHYLSQFFYLCMGYRESDLEKADKQSELKGIDIVFSGHAHKNIEFRLEKDKNHEVRIFSDVYSQLLDGEEIDEWWSHAKPVLVQTAACGLKGMKDREPPYFRKVVVDGRGQILDFRVRNNKGVVKF